MSYSQILRRLNRIIKGELTDVMDRLRKDAEELDAFDKELRSSARGASADGRRTEAPNAGAQGASREGRPGPGSQQGTGSQQASGSQRGQQSRSGGAGEGLRKPGEKDDAHYYAVLGLAPGASVETIKSTYKRLMRQYHPDRVSNLPPEQQKTALEKAKAVNEAYQIIERRRGFK